MVEAAAGSVGDSCLGIALLCRPVHKLGVYMNLTDREQDGLGLLMSGMGIGVACLYAFLAISGVTDLAWLLLLPFLAALTLAALGAIFLMHRGPERFCAYVNRLKRDVWQPLPPFRSRK
jgi:hypothetical protein